VSVAGLYSSVLLSEKIALNVVFITGRDGILVSKPCNLAGIALEENGRGAYCFYHGPECNL
jgi:hypothetical protein